MTSAGRAPIESVLSILEKLVAFDTSKGSTIAAQSYLAELFSSMGLQTHLYRDGDNANLLVTSTESAQHADGQPATRILAGHIDTVDYAKEAWSTDPLSLTYRDGMYYGLGACDMKGAIACIVESIRLSLASDPELPLVVCITYGEEKGLAGATKLLENQYAKEFLQNGLIIIGEPTCLKAGIAHKGFFGFKVSITGRSVHSSRTEKGLNAIYAAASLCSVLQRLSLVLLDAGSGHPAAGSQLNVCKIAGGEGSGIVPESAVLTGELRPAPGVEPDFFIEILQRELHGLSQFGYRCDWSKTYHARSFQAGRHDPRASELASWLGIESAELSFATEASVYAMLDQTDCVIIGPGNIRDCHCPNECISRQQLIQAVSMYTKILSYKPPLKRERYDGSHR